MTKHTYLAVDVKGGWADVIELDELPAMVRRHPGLFVLDMTAALEGFTRAMGADTSRTFSTAEISVCAGISLAMANHWTRLGVLPPSASPARGCGYERRWSWQDAFYAGLLGVLSRQGVGTAMLRAITGALVAARAGQRATDELAVQPAGV